MQGKKAIVATLNGLLRNELTAINQYFLHARMLRNWGFTRLAKHEYEESIDEMKHADRLVERILLLDGLPNLQDLGKLLIGEDVPEVIANDLKLERAAHGDLVTAVAECEKARDYVSRELVSELLVETEEHIDFLETQLELIAKLGLPNYLQSAMGEVGG